MAVIGILNKWYKDAIAPASIATVPARGGGGSSRIKRSSRAVEQTASASFFRTILVFFVLIGAFIGIIVMYGLNRYFEYRDNIENSRLELFNSTINPPGPSRLSGVAQGLFVNIFAGAVGPYPSVGMTHNVSFEYPERPYSKAEEDRLFKIVGAGTPEPNKSGSEIYSGHSGAWFTHSDPKFGDQDWQEVLGSKKLVYILVEMKYYVKGALRVTESCTWINDGFLVVHLCAGHNKTYTVQ